MCRVGVDLNEITKLRYLLDMACGLLCGVVYSVLLFFPPAHQYALVLVLGRGPSRSEELLYVYSCTIFLNL